MTAQPRSLDRAYRAFVRCHDVIRGAATEADLYAHCCRVAVEELGYRLAWIGLVSPGETVVRAVGQAGFEEGYLADIRITVDDAELGRGPTGRAIREGRPAVAQDIATDPRFQPWREEALQRGYASSAALPLQSGGRVLGTLNLYASEPDAFDDDEIALLEQVAVDLVIGIQRVRLLGVLDEVNRRIDRLQRIEAAGLAASVLAHDINNLLQVVSLAVGVSRRTDDESERSQALDDAETAIQTLGTLSRQLLTLTHRDAGPEQLADIDRVTVSLEPLLHRLARGSVLTLSLGAQSSLVPVAAVDLERMLVNLVVNAHQSMPDGGPIRVETGIRSVESSTPISSGTLSPGAYAVIRVIDRGAGIAPDVLPRIFEPLFTTKDDEGTGLGLHSVLAVVQPVGGGVLVESQLEVGTQLSIFLPVAGTVDAPC